LQMRSFLLVLLTLPAAMAVHQCWSDGMVGTRNVVQKADCENADEDFCMKTVWIDENDDNVKTRTHTTRSCGNGNCTAEVCENAYPPSDALPTMSPLNPTTCCCQGKNFCNGAAGSSLMTSLAAAVAAAFWLRQ
ncbi:hypothetical protein PENTCL1PPCAC_19339, partial [Pristionchus entomophagus]